MYICMYLCMYTDISIYVCLCMHVFVYRCMYMYVYCICIHMHVCVCIFENTQSSYVRTVSLENGGETYACGKRLPEFKVFLKCMHSETFK